LMVATKETWIINGPVLLIALVVTQDYWWLRATLQGQVKQIFFSFTGRIDRRTFWVLSINIFLASLVIGFLIVKTSTAIDVGQAVRSIIYFVLALAATTWIGLAIQVKRWHDIGRSGWMALIGFIPIVGPLIALVYLGFFRSTTGPNEFGDVSRSNPLLDRSSDTITRLGGPVPLATIALVAFAVFITVNVLFYSSFFTNYPKGVSDAMQTLRFWSHRTHEHEHPWYQYIQWLIQEESVLMILGGLGALIAVWRANNRLAVFLSLWSFGLLAAYSLVGYKTPWISLNFIVPLALTSGYTLEVAYQKLRAFGQRWLFILLAVLIAAPCTYQMYELNFVHYDDDAYPYVYAHTRRELHAMLDEIDKVSKRMGTGTDTGIAIVSPDYWPLPWYLRDYKKVGYYQQIVATTEPIIIGSTAQEEQLKQTYGDRYVLVPSGKEDSSYALRPGVDLLLYVRKDVAK